MSELTQALLKLTEFDESRVRSIDKYARNCAWHENARLRPLILALIEVAKEAGDVLWINECRCDSAYTDRGMHGPNALCGEMDILKASLAQLQALVKGEE